MIDSLAPPIIVDLWPALRDRIDTPRMAGILGGSGRNYIRRDVQGPAGPEGETWARNVIVPGLRPGGNSFVLGEAATRSFGVRTDVNDTQADGFNPNLTAQLAQQEAWRRLHGWAMPFTTSDQVRVVFAPRLVTGWDDEASEDESSGTVFLLSRYLVDVETAPSV